MLTEPNHKTVLGGRVLKSEGPAGATEDPAQRMVALDMVTFFYF